MKTNKNKNILLIDDSAVVRKLIRIMLEEQQYNVYEAKDGEEGIEKYKSLGNIDLVITDIYMPKKSGLDLVLELEKEYSDVKIIVLSDGGKDKFSNKLGVCEALGATYFIKKDSVKEGLINLVSKAIAQ